MPGTPHHALGDPLLTAAATTFLAAGVVASAVGLRSRLSDPRLLAAGGGVAYGVLFVSLWTLVRLVFWRFAAGPTERLLLFAGIVAVGSLVLVLQGGVALYLWSRWDLATPLGGLFVVSWVCGYLFLRVGGESGALFTMFLWAGMVGPVAIAAVVVLAAAEAGVGRLYRGARGAGGT
jgi:hypothetical protein